MKTNVLSKMLAVMAAAGVAFSAATVSAQNAPASSTPQLSYGVTDVLKLTQAKASDDTIIAYIRNSGNSYGLDADQIIYLQQEGVSSPVLTAMLNQPRAGIAPASDNSMPQQVPQPMTPAPAPQPDNTQMVTTQPPAVTYVQPATTYYYGGGYPYYYNSYPYYYGYPAVSFSVGWGGGWRGGWGGGWGGGWHGGGGWGGGWHGGGGWHR